MDTNSAPGGRFRRTVDSLIVAEMFFVQATIESATAIGDGLSALGRQIASPDESGDAPADAITQDGDSRSFSHTWGGDLAVEELTWHVQQPATASDLAVTAEVVEAVVATMLGVTSGASYAAAVDTDVPGGAVLRAAAGWRAPASAPDDAGAPQMR